MGGIIPNNIAGLKCLLIGLSDEAKTGEAGLYIETSIIGWDISEVQDDEFAARPVLLYSLDLLSRPGWPAARVIYNTLENSYTIIHEEGMTAETLRRVNATMAIVCGKHVAEEF